MKKEMQISISKVRKIFNFIFHLISFYLFYTLLLKILGKMFNVLERSFLCSARLHYLKNDSEYCEILLQFKITFFCFNPF